VIAQSLKTTVTGRL